MALIYTVLFLTYKLVGYNNSQSSAQLDMSVPNALPNILKYSTHSLFTYFSPPSKIFLLLVLLSHRARSMLLQSTPYINYLLTYLKVLVFLRLFVLELEASTGQTDGRTGKTGNAA